MRYGLFMMPSHPPERELFQAHQWDLDCLSLADDLGYDEAWIGEHFTSPWEPIPAPDIMIAQALMRTKNIKLATGVHLLPYHHPAELAHRVAYLDHLAQGRFMFGIGSGGLPSDYALFNVDGNAGEHREMTRESLDIILKIWENDGPFEYKGKFWNVNLPEPMYGFLKYFLNPYQRPHPPIAVAAASIASETLKIAGERGFIPMSLGLNNEYIASHWESVAEGAARAGKTPSRRDWRIVRDVYVADSDDEAYEKSVNGMLGRVWRDYLIPLFAEFVMVIGTVPIFQGMTAWFVVLEREFGWSRAQLSLAFSLTRAEGTVMGPLAGYLVDKVGPRRMVLSGLPVMGTDTTPGAARRLAGTSSNAKPELHS